MDCKMNEQAERAGLSSGNFTTPGTYGSPLPERDPGMDIPPCIAAAMKEWRQCLGAVSHTLRCLSVAAMYDKAIDTASAGVADIARRIIDETVKEIELLEDGLSPATNPNRALKSPLT